MDRKQSCPTPHAKSRSTLQIHIHLRLAAARDAIVTLSDRPPVLSPRAVKITTSFSANLIRWPVCSGLSNQAILARAASLTSTRTSIPRALLILSSLLRQQSRSCLGAWEIPDQSVQLARPLLRGQCQLQFLPLASVIVAQRPTQCVSWHLSRRAQQLRVMPIESPAGQPIPLLRLKAICLRHSQNPFSLSGILEHGEAPIQPPSRSSFVLPPRISQVRRKLSLLKQPT